MYYIHVYGQSGPSLLIESVDSMIVQYFRTMSLCQHLYCLPTASQTQLSPNILQEVNQAVRAMQPKENGGRRASKRKYMTSFTPEDRASTGKHGSENGNAAAVKKFKATHEIIGESTVRLHKKRYVTVKPHPHIHTRLRGVACLRSETHLFDSQCSPKCPVRNY